ncbi:hypothetical protein [Alkalihalobacterium bogoriense]|nr:hypothetical protein [Alkalihalobacterium bogoriense]
MNKVKKGALVSSLFLKDKKALKFWCSSEALKAISRKDAPSFS